MKLEYLLSSLYEVNILRPDVATGGSGGQNALGTGAQNSTSATGGNYGGGGGAIAGGGGASGAVRIIWGAGRSFPNNAT